MQEAPFRPRLRGSRCSWTAHVGTWWRAHHDVPGVLVWAEVCGMDGQSLRVSSRNCWHNSEWCQKMGNGLQAPPANPFLASSCLISCPLVFVAVVQTAGEIDSQALLIPHWYPRSMIELELHWDWLCVPFILWAGTMLFVWLLKTFWHENTAQYFPNNLVTD